MRHTPLAAVVEAEQESDVLPAVVIAQYYTLNTLFVVVYCCGL